MHPHQRECLPTLRLLHGLYASHIHIRSMTLVRCPESARAGWCVRCQLDRSCFRYSSYLFRCYFSHSLKIVYQKISWIASIIFIYFHFFLPSQLAGTVPSAPVFSEKLEACFFLWRGRAIFSISPTFLFHFNLFPKAKKTEPNSTLPKTPRLGRGKNMVKFLPKE